MSTLIAVKDQEPLNITAPIIAFPEPFIYWTFVNNISLVNVTHKTSNRIIKNRVFSNLYIANVTEEDFGFYLVYAFNEIGKTTNAIHTFEVIPASKFINLNEILLNYFDKPMKAFLVRVLISSFLIIIYITLNCMSIMQDATIDFKYCLECISRKNNRRISFSHSI